jgi:cob(I)alamin adenosyltransferase
MSQPSFSDPSTITLYPAQTSASPLINPEFSRLGCLQIYTGEGKGKTMAALGLAFRALSNGWDVLLVLFSKAANEYAELYSTRQLSPQIAKHLTVVQAGSSRVSFTQTMKSNEAIEIANGWQIAKRATLAGKYQLVILDEITSAIESGLIPLDEMTKLIADKPSDVEMVLTGRNAQPELLEMAQLVSHITSVKHEL